MDRRQFLVAGAGALAALAGCLGGPDRALPERPTGSWRQHAHDARNTGSSDAAAPPRGTPAWDSGEAHVAAPLVEDGTVYSVGNEATAVDARTGEYRWETELEGSADDAPALTDDALVVAADRQVRGLDREDGSALWERSLPTPVTDPVTLSADGSTALVPLADTGLVALDADTGDRLWTDGLRGTHAPATDGDDVYVTGYRSDGDAGILRSIARGDGSQRWEVGLDGPDTSPVVLDEGLLVADEGTLAVHAREDGARRRTVADVGGGVRIPPAVDDGTAYVATGDDELAAVSLADGSVEWRRDHYVTTGLAVGREAVVAPVEDLPEAGLPGLVAFERPDGSVRWEKGIEGFDARVSTPPTLADGAVFYASNESVGVVALGDLPPRDDE